MVLAAINKIPVGFDRLPQSLDRTRMPFRKDAYLCLRYGPGFDDLFKDRVVSPPLQFRFVQSFKYPRLRRRPQTEMRISFEEVRLHFGEAISRPMDRFQQRMFREKPVKNQRPRPASLCLRGCRCARKRVATSGVVRAPM